MTTPTDPVERWTSILDELEAGLTRFEAQLESGEVVEVTRWTPAEDLAPLPGELWARATSLSWWMVAVEQRIQDRRDALRAELDDLERRRGAGAAYAASGANVTHTDDPR